MKRLLVVEDEPGISLGLEDDLKLEGYQVEVIEDGELALQRAREETFDLIILDVMLPGKDGFQVCQALRREGIGTPIIMLTAKDQEAEKVLGLELGADDYVTKPFSPMDSWDYWGSWSPDGRKFFFLGTGGLNIFDWSTSEIKRRPFSPSPPPRWSRDGTTAVWTTERAMTQLWLMENFQ